MVTEQHAAGALDGSVDPEELTTLLAQENQALLVTLAQLKAENSALKATQPAAGEPVYQLRNTVIKGPWRELDKVAYDNAAGLSAYERRILWTAPPAAAHGDEAVRKPVLAGYFSFCEDKQKWLQQKSKGAEFNHLFTPLYAMRAQGDGGEA